MRKVSGIHYFRSEFVLKGSMFFRERSLASPPDGELLRENSARVRLRVPVDDRRDEPWVILSFPDVASPFSSSLSSDTFLLGASWVSRTSPGAADDEMVS